MKDNLSDAIRGAVFGEKRFAEKLADAIRDEIELRLEAAKPQPAEPRRNPYEDDKYYMRVMSGPDTSQTILIRAWNEGAQSAGERDE